MSLEVDMEETWNALKEQYRLFPYRCCKPAVREMYLKGYEIVAGVVRVDNYCNMEEPYELQHYWNSDPTIGQNFDITASQFNIHLSVSKQLPKFAIWSGNNTLVYVEKQRGLQPDQVI